MAKAVIDGDIGFRNLVKFYTQARPVPRLYCLEMRARRSRKRLAINKKHTPDKPVRCYAIAVFRFTVHHLGAAKSPLYVPAACIVAIPKS